MSRKKLIAFVLIAILVGSAVQIVRVLSSGLGEFEFEPYLVIVDAHNNTDITNQTHALVTDDYYKVINGKYVKSDRTFLNGKSIVHSTNSSDSIIYMAITVNSTGYYFLPNAFMVLNPSIDLNMMDLDNSGIKQFVYTLNVTQTNQIYQKFKDTNLPPKLLIYIPLIPSNLYEKHPTIIVP